MDWSQHRPDEVSEDLRVDVARRASAYRAGLGSRNVFPDEAALHRRNQYDKALPNRGAAAGDVMSELDALARACNSATLLSPE